MQTPFCYNDRMFQIQYKKRLYATYNCVQSFFNV